MYLQRNKKGKNTHTHTQNHIFKVDSEKSTERDSTETKAGQRKNKLLSNCIGTTTPPPK